MFNKHTFYSTFKMSENSLPTSHRNKHNQGVISTTDLNMIKKKLRKNKVKNKFSYEHLNTNQSTSRNTMNMVSNNATSFTNVNCNQGHKSSQQLPEISKVHSTKNSQKKEFQLPVKNDKDIISKNEILVKKLDDWEEKHISKNFNFSNQFSMDKSNIEINTLNWDSNIRESLSKLNLKFVSHVLKDFYKKEEEEQSSILLQNINITKKKFNFKVFDGPKIKGQRQATDIVENELVKVGNQLLIRKKNNKGDYFDEGIDYDDNYQCEVRIEEPFLKVHNLKIEGNYEKLISTDFYREVISKKMKIENIYKKFIFSLVKELNKRRSQKNDLQISYGKLLGETQKLKEEYVDKEETFLYYKKEKEKLFNHNLISASQVYSNHSSPYVDKESPAKEVSNFKFDLFTSHSQDVNRQERNLKNFKCEIETKIKKIKEEMQFKDRKLKIIEKEIKWIKQKIQTKTDEQKKYFMEILKKGIDVRNEGLSWIVKRLFEFGCEVEITNFPKFINQQQANYIIQYSQRQIELNRVKAILEVLRNRQLKTRDETKSNFFNTSTNNFISTARQTGIINKLNFPESDKKDVVSPNIDNIIENIIINNNCTMRKSYEQKLEDYKINQMIVEFIKYIKSAHMNQVKPAVNNSNNQKSPKKQNSNELINLKANCESIFDIFENNGETKEYYKEIVALKKKVKELEYEITKLKQNQLSFFKAKYENYKIGGTLKCVHYELMFAALFGNHVII